MVGNLLTALFSTVGYCLLMNVPVKKIIPASIGGSAYYAMLGLVQSRFADMRHYALLTGQWAVGLAAGICAVAVIRQIGQYMQRHGG